MAELLSSGQKVRSYWVAVAILIAGCAITFSTASATGTTTFSVITTIQPCRLLDTRPGLENVGPRNRPIGPGETYSLRVAGVNQGNCSIPAGTTGLLMNVTIVNPSSSSYLTVWPSDGLRPTASSLNWVASQGPTPNQVTSALSTNGSISIFNNSGTVDVLVDIAGFVSNQDAASVFYTKSEVDALIAANPGPQGERGPSGPAGVDGADGTNGRNGTNGADGADGTNGVSGYEVVTSTGSFTWAQIQDTGGGLLLRGASCPSGKVLINQGITWAAFNDVNAWHNTFPSVHSVNIDTSTQTPVFWISTGLSLSGERWDYTATSTCATV